MRLAVLLAAFVVVMASPAFAGASVNPPDPYLWLESIDSPRALDWVNKENARSLAVLKGDPRYGAFHAQALAIFNATDRIPTPSLIGTAVYNLWQDPVHVRGLWRRTTPESYATANPVWETVLDLDALSAREKANWVWKGANCLLPRFDRCLIQLSDGGEDAVTVREFDLTTKAFAAGGFTLPRGKQTVDWLDRDTLILSRDWGPGTLTTSGYPFVVKTLKRGQPLEQATEVFHGQPTDVGVDPNVLRDGDGNTVALISRATDFFHTETYQVTANGAVKLALPQKADMHGLLAGALIFSVEEPWRLGGTTFKAGALLAVKPSELVRPATANAMDFNADPLIFTPTARQSVQQVTVTPHHVVATIYDNVRGNIFAFSRHGDRGWSQAAFPITASASVSIATASDIDDTLYYSVETFLEPTRLFQADTATGRAQPVKSLAARFDAGQDTVEQFEATSSDGAKIPYFVVHPKTMPLDGDNPTLLYAYGGFQVSELPTYSATLGKLWLERSGVYVLANIRGGGEFGPAWHEAGLKAHRQLIYDDFAAVARDLIARKITSPRRLGIEGGSNGGLLMGVEFNQHPDLFNAVVIQVPLLDMLRFEQIGAGASWVGEYGGMSNPDEAVFLKSISPYHNLKAGVAYPEPFFVTSTKDDRVTPVHARKMAAKMRELGLPFLYFENTNGGHAASANLQERAERTALEFIYLTRKLMD